MPDVVALLEYPTLNGGERSLLSSIRVLKETGLTFAAVAPKGGPLGEALLRHEIDHVPFSFHDEQGSRLPLKSIRHDLQRALESLNPSLLHANSLSASRIAGPVAKCLSLKSLGHLRDILRVSRQAIEDLNCNTRLLAVSRATLRYHRAAGLATDTSTVVYNGVDTSEFQPAKRTGFLHQEIGIPPACRLIGTIGQISLRKGLDVALDAFSQFASEQPDAHLLMIGQRLSNKAESVELEQQLRQRATTGPMRGRVHFLRWRNDICRILPELSILLHAARQEPLGRVLLEAGSCGVPIVATDVGGTGEIFPSAAEAMLVPPDDSKAIASCLRRIYSDPQFADSLGRCAQNRIETHFHHRHAASELANQYRLTASFQKRPS